MKAERKDPQARKLTGLFHIHSACGGNRWSEKKVYERDHFFAEGSTPNWQSLLPESDVHISSMLIGSS